MFKETELNDQAEQLGDIIEKLASITENIREAFVQQQSRSLEGIANQYLDLNEEIAFDAVMADEPIIGKSLDDREPIFRFQNILSHLQRIDKSLQLLADVLGNQMKEQVLLNDMERKQVTVLLERQEKILQTLAGAVWDGDRKRLNSANIECHEMALSCLNFATTYETRLVEGLCTPRSALILLNIFDRLQTLVHNELETVKLLSRWIWDFVTYGTDQNRTGQYSH